MIFQLIDKSRVRLTADRGFPEHSLFVLLDELGVNFVVRVKGSTKVHYQGQWIKLNQIKFHRNERHFKQSRVKQVHARSRLFALFVIAMVALITLSIQLLVRNGNTAQTLLRRVASRRGKRRELSLIAATIALIQQEPSLLGLLTKNLKLNLLDGL